MSYYIYEIKNLLNGKTYIGQRKLPNGIIIEFDKYFGSGRYLRNAINKYGKENFQKTILKEGLQSKQEADEVEREFIRKYREQGRAEYNIADGGNGGNLGYEVNRRISVSLKTSEKFQKIIKQKMCNRIVSEETRRKISEAKKGKKGHKWNDDQRKKIHLLMSGENNPMFGKHPTEETKQKIREKVKAKMTDERRQELSRINKGRKRSEEFKQNLREKNLGNKNPMFGKHHTEEAKQILREKSKNQIVSDETRKKHSEITKQQWANEENKKRRIESAKKFWSNEENRQKRSVVMKQIWKKRKK